MIVVQSSWGVELREFNPCHHPAGGPQGGQFCSTADRVQATWDALHSGVANVVTELAAKGWEASGRPHLDISVAEWHQEALLHNVKKDIARAIYDHPDLGGFIDGLRAVGPVSVGKTQQAQAEYAAERIATEWAVTSFRSPLTYAIQRAVAEVFRLDAQAPDPGGPYKAKKLGDPLYEAHADFFHRVVRDQYERTQRFFAERGIKEVTLLRGTAAAVVQMQRGSGGRPAAGERRVRFNPLTSWTADHEIAERFGQEHVIVARLPVSEIFSTARTGLGTLEESEYVTLGGSRTVKVYDRKDWTWPPK